MSNNKENNVECGNCEWKGTDDTIKPWYYCHDLSERMMPGEIVPAGECPECEAFVYYTNDGGTRNQWRDLANNAVNCLEAIRDGGTDSVWREVAEIIEDRLVLNGETDESDEQAAEATPEPAQLQQEQLPKGNLSFGVLRDAFDQGPCFVITPTEHWLSKHRLLDRSFEVPKGFSDLAESYFQYTRGSIEEGRQVLLHLGHTEDFNLRDYADMGGPEPEPEPALEPGTAVHVCHCTSGGCKYGDADCPVVAELGCEPEPDNEKIDALNSALDLMQRAALDMASEQFRLNHPADKPKTK